MANKQPKKGSSQSALNEALNELAKGHTEALQNLLSTSGMSTSIKLNMDAQKVIGNMPTPSVLPQNSSNQLSGQNMALSFSQQLTGYYNPPSPPSLGKPKFQRGDQVTVRAGKTVWTVSQSIDPTTVYVNEWIYALEHPTKGRIKEFESDLKLADKAIQTPVKPKAKVDFDTVVIEDEKRQQILEALEQINQHTLIFEQWGFSETIEKGTGVSMLFYGSPGTGKTLMAQAIANKLDYKLKVISTADIESSAPGEAERNIRKHFKKAKGGKTILLFDECDSLIYTRQNVGPILSAQINELLSQIERFDGITLFTTNRLGTLDEALNRRLALKLEFAMPSQEQRAEIWKRMIPKQAPLDKDVDFHRLAVVELSGGYIKNAVLRAARMAAIEKVPDKKKKIAMKHLVKALTQEAKAMMEFEDARDDYMHGFGRVVGNTLQRGRGTIQKEIA
jgi:AAA+ superfamily predicted ATPase